MKDNPLLTVIIPVFNTEDVLPRCLNSLLNQVQKKIKIILVDDCSTDNSLNIIKSFSEKNSNISYVSTSINSGAGYARNKALEFVKTKYVSFLDSDDWIDSVAYKRALETLEKNDSCNIAIFGIKTEFDSIFTSQVKCAYEHSNIIDNRFAISLLCRTTNYDLMISSMLGNKIFRTELLKKNNITFKHSYFEDVYVSFLAFYHSQNICLIKDTYLHYYQRTSSVMHTFSEKYINELITVFIDLKSFLISHECFSEYQRDYFAFLNRSIYSLMNMIFSTEQNDRIQKKLIIYLVELLVDKFTTAEIINNLDIQLIKEIFLN